MFGKTLQGHIYHLNFKDHLQTKMVERVKIFYKYRHQRLQRHTLNKIMVLFVSFVKHSLLKHFFIINRGLSGRDRMVIRSTTTFAISPYHY